VYLASFLASLVVILCAGLPLTETIYGSGSAAYGINLCHNRSEKKHSEKACKNRANAADIGLGYGFGKRKPGAE